jgi:hypothetical protein
MSTTLSPERAANSTMNSPYRVHPALPLQPEGKTIPFPKASSSATPAQSPSGGAAANKLLLLVKLEGEIRQKETPAAVVFHALNEARGLIEFEQGFFFRRNRRGGFGCEAVSNVASIDVHVPLTAAMTRVVGRIPETEKTLPFSLAKQLPESQYPLPDSLWVPLLDRNGKAFAGFLFNRVGPWTEESQTIAKRMGEAYGHALRVHSPPQLLRSLSLPRWALYGVPLTALLLAFVPVPLTTLAPFEVVPLSPMPVTAPIDGAVALIMPDPNVQVKKGDVLLRLDSTLQKADADIASQKLAVASARLETARNGAFSDQEMKRSLSVIEREMDLAQAELDCAQSLLARTEVVAPAPGLLIYTSKADWAGKPVRIGEKIMEIADPKRVAYRIDLAVHDSIALEHGASVRLFFDADPLNPRAALLYEESYHATEKAGGMLSYTLRAKPKDDGPPPRIGLRGTAQMSGEWVSLGFYLLRRPIAAARQYFGM